MSDYATLKSAIQAAIKQNGNNEITGPVLQSSLLSMINSLGANYQFVGVATPTTNPGTPDQNVFYIASQAGAYSNFGGITLVDNELCALKYNGTWTKEDFGISGGEYDVNFLKTVIGGLDMSGFEIGGINAETGAETVASSRIRTGFIDGRNNDIVVKTTNNIVLRLVLCYNQIDGTPTRYVSFNTNEFTFRTDAYGCYMRFVFSRSNDGDCSPSDFQYISIQGIGLSNELTELQQQVNAIPVIDFDTFKPWAEIPEHNGILLSTYMQVYGFAGNTHKIIPITGAKKIQVRANTNYIARFALVKSYTEPAATGQTPFDFATGETSQHDIPIGTLSAVYNIPNDANFVIVSSLMGSESANAEPAQLLIDNYDVINGVRKEIGNLNARVQSLEDSVSSVIILESGGINTSTGVPTVASSRVRTNYIHGGFFIEVNDLYEIYFVLEYDLDGTYLGVLVESPGQFYDCGGTNVYRVVIRRKNNADLSPTEDIIKTKRSGFDYFYSNKSYGFVRGIENEHTEKTLVPYVRGTLNGNVLTYNEANAYERLVLAFLTDNHIDLGNFAASYQNVVDAIDFLNNLRVPVAAIIEGGDIVTKIKSTKAAHIEQMQPFFNLGWTAKMPLLFTKGNHDINTINVPPSQVLDDDDWGQVWFNKAETDYGIVRQTKSNGKKSGYYYYDLTAWKVRIICVDCTDVDTSKTNQSGNVLYSGGSAWYVANEQFNWICNTALNFDDKAEKDWGVIVFMHYYRPSDTEGTSIEPIFAPIYRKFNNMLLAFNSQSTFVENYTFADNTFYNLAINASWTRYANLDAKPYLIGVISGHTHTDNNVNWDGVQQIVTANQFCGENASDLRIKRVALTATQNLFDLFVIDLKAKKIRAIRYGAGINCYGTGGNRFLPDGLSF